MASIDIQHAHSLPPARARQGVQDVADKLRERFGIDYRWDGDILKFSRSGVDGRIALMPNQLHLTAQLGLIFGAMKGTIEAEIRKELAERFE